MLVIPAALNSGAGQAGIQPFMAKQQELGSGFRRNDEHLLAPERRVTMFGAMTID